MRWAFWVAFEWCLLLLALALPAISWWLLPVSLLLLGSRQHALTVLGHEAVHQGGWKERVANVLCFWPVGVDLYAFREFHLGHHKHVNTVDDPEVRHRMDYPETWGQLTPGRKIQILLADLVGASWREARWAVRENRGEYGALRKGTIVVMMCAATVAAWWAVPLWVWALFTTTWASMRARMWREHHGLGPGETYEYIAKWWERALYLPHFIWKHRAHHTKGRGATPCWDL